MFYAHYVLSKKGPLARIWLAAHWDKKLTRTNVFDTNISSSVEAILQPQVKLALRTSGHLLLGVVRIYSRQAKYLLADCNEAFVKIKMAFRPGVDMPDDIHRENPVAAITLQENLNDIESTLADLHDEIDTYAISVNQSRPEDITMREEFGEPNLGRPDDDFGDSTFEDVAERDFEAEAIPVDGIELDHNELDNTLNEDLARPQNYVEIPPSVGMPNNECNDEFGDVIDVDYDSGDNLDSHTMDESMFQENCNTTTEPQKEIQSFSVVDSELVINTTSEETHDVTLTVAPRPLVVEKPDNPVIQTQRQIVTEPPQKVNNSLHTAHTTQLPRFILPPINDTRTEHRRGPKRKRKLLIDEHKSIPSDVMKLQMQDTSDITTRLDLAPPTRKLMLWKETGSVDVLLTTPGRPIYSRVLQKLFYRNLKTRPVPNDSVDGLPFVRNDASRVDSIENNDIPAFPVMQSNLFMDELQDESHDPQTPAGACSTYSTNYDYNVPDTPKGVYEMQTTVLDTVISERHEVTLNNDEIVNHYETIGEMTFTAVKNDEQEQPDFEDVKELEEQRKNIFPVEENKVVIETVVEKQEVLPILENGLECNKLQLQNAMQTLDNELDIVDEEFSQQEMIQDRLEKRSEIMLNVLQKTFEKQKEVVFQDLTVTNNKKQAASKFYTLLLLGKQNKIKLKQDTPLSNIVITPYITVNDSESKSLTNGAVLVDCV